MKRVTGFSPRQNMREILLDVGFDYYNLPSTDGSHYWSDQVAYEFNLKEIDRIEDAANELHQMCLDFVDDEVREGHYEHYHFTDLQKQLIEESWRKKDPHLYGRFDFGYDGKNLKMFEYNADTPTSLLEASVVQWQWQQYFKKEYDQFNWIHEELQKRFKYLQRRIGRDFHFVAMEDAGREDWGNLDYLADVANSVGWNIHRLAVEDIGLIDKTFVDLNNQPIEALFKLYPLEWMTQSDFAPQMLNSQTHFFEPAWKMLLSNKVLLGKLWEKHPNHPLLLPTYFGKEKLKGSAWIKKPILGREGANISAYYPEFEVEVAEKGSEHSDFYDTFYVYQQKFEMPNFDNMYPMLGVWVVGDVACGMGMREDFTAVTGNDSHFIPHYFKE